MGILKSLSIAEKKWPLGILFGLVGILFGIYQTYFYEIKPELQIEILSETSVLSVHESISDLSINFKGENLSQTGNELRILILKIKNTGNKNILPSDFQPQKPWGIKILPGSIIDLAVTDTNSTKIKEALNPQKVESEIRFTPTIFEKERFFSLKILMLVPKDANIDISSLDSIADIDNVKIERRSENEQRSLADKAFTGDTLVQIVRVVGYTIICIIGLILFLIIIVTPIVSVIDKSQRYLRQRKIINFKLNDKLDQKIFSAIEKIYLSEGSVAIVNMYETLSNQQLLNSTLEIYDKQLSIPAHPEADNYIIVDESRRKFKYKKALTDAGMLIKDQGGWRVNQEFVKTLKKFLDHLGK